MQSSLLLFVINVILFGLVRKNCQAFGFGLAPSPLNVVPLSAVAPNVVPLSAVAPSPFAPSPFAPSPFAFPAPFPPAYPFAPAPPVVVVAQPFPPAPCFPPAFPPYPAPPYNPHLGLASAILNLILAKKGKYLPPPYPYPPPPFPYPPPPPPPPPPYPYPPQHPRALPDKHVLNVHITKDSADDKKHNHWHDDKPKWN